MVTSLVSTHTTHRALCVELILFAVQNIMVGAYVYFVHTYVQWTYNLLCLCLALEVILLEDSKVLRNYYRTIHG
jgi:hypothetical protein